MRLSLIPRIQGWIFALDAAFAGANVGHQVRDVGIGQVVVICRHEGTAVFDFGGDVFVGNGGAGNQRGPLIKIGQVRGALGVLVVTHPALEGVNHFAARRAAIALNPVSIQAQRALEIVYGGFVFIGIGGWLRLGRGVGDG